MTEPPNPPTKPDEPQSPRSHMRLSGISSLFTLRKPIPRWQALLAATLCVLTVVGIWWFVTRGEPEERMIGPTVLPSPHETFASFHNLWVDRRLPENIWASLRRVVLGFGLAAAVGIPIGVL